MKILIFLKDNVLNLNDFTPISGAAEKVTEWISNGAEVEFITGVHKFMEVKKIDEALKVLGVSNPVIHAKPENEKFHRFVAELEPNVLIENKQNSGEEKTVSSKLDPELKIHGIVMESGAEIELLPGDPSELKHYGKAEEAAGAKDDTY
ncbi:hypothetical protein HQ571_04905 [Candidatus Kuenenbacteria bacterium]|nr:hypothetical protein [Candidatus Kuenenbacteria bacterium]